MIAGLATAVATTAFSAFAEGTVASLAAYSIAKGIGRSNFSFKK